MEIRYGEYVISDDKRRLDLAAIRGFLARSYWAADRPEARIVRSIENSRCFGVYAPDGSQVAYARVVTDDATVYYLCDVFVDEASRGQGIGKALVDAIVNDDKLRDLFGFLGTADAHGLYEQYGFVREPERFMRKFPVQDPR